MKRSIFTFLFLFLILAAAGGWFYYVHDSTPPTIVWKNPTELIGKKGQLEIEIKDSNWGIGEISVTIQSSAGKTVELFQESYPTPLKEKTLTIDLDMKKLRIKQGEVKLHISAFDKPSIELFSPNQGSLSAAFTVDITPPRLMPISGLMYLWRGGSQMAVYRVSEDTVSSGVRFGGRSYRGYTGVFPDKPRIGVVFFAFPVNEKPKGYPILFARDQVGNESVVALNVRLKNKNFRSSDINIPDSFLDRKMPVLAQTNEIPGKTNLEIYLYANRTLRKQNAEAINQICRKSIPRILWEGKFHQLSNSKVESRFADHRNYYYKAEKIDEQDHMGVDLAVTRHYKVGAAARGVVIFEGNLGIYGNNVILDHGLGIFTLYGHLSMIDVKIGQQVDKKEIIGKTGETGLAGGDHLHFAVLIHGTPVNPLEWWDRSWIQNSVFNKLRGFLPRKPIKKIHRPQKDARQAEDTIQAKETLQTEDIHQEEDTLQTKENLLEEENRDRHLVDPRL